jgi:post-segregation antitoxin (ccd killing protein)
MPRMQVYLPDDLYAEVKQRGFAASELLQIAVRAEMKRQDALDATDEYLADLIAKVGEPTAEQTAKAEAITNRILSRQLRQAS